MAAYQALAWLGLALGWPAIALRALRDPRYRTGWAERLGFWGQLPCGAGPLWVHGASVGEIRAAAPLIRAIRARRIPLLVTTTSPSGREAARELAGPDGASRLLPLDLLPLVGKAIRAARPRALVVVETELWPALLWQARKAEVPALLVNGRVSDRTYPRYWKLRRWVGTLLGAFSDIQAQTAEDAERFRALGAPSDRVSVAGNLKFDLPPPDPGAPEVRALRRARAGGWRVFVAGSTHPGEEEAVLSAAVALRTRGVRLGLVLAPRHLERVDEVEALVRSRGLGLARWGHLADPLEASILDGFERGDVLLVDRYGLLGGLYGASEVAFVGGSLAPVGGHNLLEPLNWGVPVVFGPHMQNAREIAREVEARGLGSAVAGPEELAEAVGRFLADSGLASSVRARARQFFDENRGTLDRALAALGRLGALERASE